MDAARISDVRENVKAVGWLTAAEALDLLDALEQARKERDEWHAAMIDWTGPEATKALLAERDTAQKDAKDARALAYEECARVVDLHISKIVPRTLYDDGKRDAALEIAATLRARIEAMLEKKP